MSAVARNRGPWCSTLGRHWEAANRARMGTGGWLLLGVMANASLLFAGCAATALPQEALGVSTIAASSSSVEIHRPRLIMKNGSLMLEAYALRQWKAETTADTHVDIVFLDTAGNAVAVETTNFNPRSLPRTMRLPGPHAYLLVPMRLPPGTRAVEVRAHDGPHETSASAPQRISKPN